VTTTTKQKHLEWQVVIKRVPDPEAVEEGERLLLRLALESLRKRMANDPEDKS
jgi:hypothetical protein